MQIAIEYTIVLPESDYLKHTQRFLAALSGYVKDVSYEHKTANISYLTQ